MSEVRVKTSINFASTTTSSTGAQADQQNKKNMEKWCQILGLTESELLVAIREFGTQIKDIRRGLRERGNNKQKAG